MQAKRKFKPQQQSIDKCDNCGSPVMRHRVCKCGFYMGEQVFTPKRRPTNFFSYPRGWQQMKGKETKVRYTK